MKILFIGSRLPYHNNAYLQYIALKKEYKNVAVWFFIIFYIALPFIINEITGRIIYAYKYVIYIVTNKLPKNVYTDL